MNLRDKIKEHNRLMKRVELVGTDGVNKQDARRRKAEKSDDPNAISKDVQMRFKEYGANRVINKVKRYKHPENK